MVFTFRARSLAARAPVRVFGVLGVAGGALLDAELVVELPQLVAPPDGVLHRLALLLDHAPPILELYTQHTLSMQRSIMVYLFSPKMIFSLLTRRLFLYSSSTFICSNIIFT